MTLRQTCDRHSIRTVGCDGCTERMRIYMSHWHAARTRGQAWSAPADLCAQRLRELAALGYPHRYLAGRIGVKPVTIFRISHGINGWVQLGTFQAIDRVHRELRDFRGPSTRARLAAERKGWMPPEPLPVPELTDESLVDEVAVARAIKGERIPLTRAEILEAWQRLEAIGMSSTAIGDLLHTAPRTVQRWRSGVYKPISKRTA